MYAMRSRLSVVLFVVGQFFGYAQSSIPKSEIVAYIDGEPVSKEEFAFFAQKNKFKVIAMYRNNHKLEYHAGFWQDKSTKTTPGDVLKSITLDNIKHVKVQFILAKQYGIIENISFRAIQELLEKENIERKIALSKNRVIYGPEQYTMDNYFDYLTSNMVIKLKDYMVRNEIIRIDIARKLLDDAKPATRFKGKSHFSQAHIISTQINQQYDEIINKMVKKTKVKINKKQMKNQVF